MITSARRWWKFFWPFSFSFKNGFSLKLFEIEKNKHLESRKGDGIRCLQAFTLCWDPLLYFNKQSFICSLRYSHIFFFKSVCFIRGAEAFFCMIKIHRIFILLLIKVQMMLFVRKLHCNLKFNKKCSLNGKFYVQKPLERL